MNPVDETVTECINVLECCSNEITLSETKVAPENGWFVDQFPFGMANFQGRLLLAFAVSLREDIFQLLRNESASFEMNPCGEET